MSIKIIYKINWTIQQIVLSINFNYFNWPLSKISIVTNTNTIGSVLLYLSSSMSLAFTQSVRNVPGFMVLYPQFDSNILPNCNEYFYITLTLSIENFTLWVSNMKSKLVFLSTYICIFTMYYFWRIFYCFITSSSIFIN